MIKLRVVKASVITSYKQSWQSGIFWYILALITILPVFFSPQMSLESTVQNTLFIIDISESMNVQDVDYPRPHSSRLALAKSAVKESMAGMPCGSRVSMGLFAGEEVVVLFEPLEVCRHFSAIEQILTRLNTNMRWVGDSWIVRGLISGINEAKKRELNLVMVTDADEMPHHITPRITDLFEYQSKVNGLLLGVGGEVPMPVPKLNEREQVKEYWTPENAVIEGNYPNLLAYVKSLPEGKRAPSDVINDVREHLSAFDKTLMQAMADALQINFTKINNNQDALNALRGASLQSNTLAERDARWIFGLFSFVFVLIGWFWHIK